MHLVDDTLTVRDVSPQSGETGAMALTVSGNSAGGNGHLWESNEEEAMSTSDMMIKPNAEPEEAVAGHSAAKPPDGTSAEDGDKTEFILTGGQPESMQPEGSEAAPRGDASSSAPVEGTMHPVPSPESDSHTDVKAVGHTAWSREDTSLCPRDVSDGNFERQDVPGSLVLVPADVWYTHHHETERQERGIEARSRANNTDLADPHSNRYKRAYHGPHKGLNGMYLLGVLPQSKVHSAPEGEAAGTSWGTEQTTQATSATGANADSARSANGDDDSDDAVPEAPHPVQ